MPWVKLIEHTEGYYSLSQVSELTGIPKSTILHNEGSILPQPAKKVGEIKMRLYTKEQIEEIKKCWIEAYKNPKELGLFTTEEIAQIVGIACDTIRKNEGKIFPRPVRVLKGHRGRLFSKEQLEIIKKAWNENVSKNFTYMIEYYNKKGFYSVSQASEMSGIPSTTIRRYEGSLFPRPAKKHKNRERLFTINQIEIMKRRWASVKTKGILGSISFYNSKGLYTISQTAKMLGKDRRTLESYAEKYSQKPIKKGKRFKFFSNKQIELIKKEFNGL